MAKFKTVFESEDFSVTADARPKRKEVLAGNVSLAVSIRYPAPGSFQSDYSYCEYSDDTSYALQSLSRERVQDLVSKLNAWLEETRADLDSSDGI
jgi:hypothetical protein